LGCVDPFALALALWQAAQVDRLLPFLHLLERPLVISGDFNAMRWSHTLRRIAWASETRRTGPWNVTFHLPNLRTPVTIDHVLTSPQTTAEVRAMPKLGSDQHGVMARISLSD
jgi:endonuclease/exonuclease/phosphatase (EEP) superfamily protein YafD